MPLKVRFGVALGGQANLPIDALGSVLDDLDRLGFDSAWIPEAFLAPSFDPVVALSYAAARVQRLKVGTHLVLPGRNVVRMARQLAQLDRLAAGRLLLVMVLGLDDRAERVAQGLPSGDRNAWFDEAVPVLRRLWAGEVVDHDGPLVRLEGARLDTLPLQQPLEMWFGGRAPTSLQRAGRLSDGWLAAAVTPDAALAGKRIVDDAAAAAGRSITPEHFGTNVAYAHAPLPETVVAAMEGRRPGAAALVPVGREALRDCLSEWASIGFSKVVVRPALPPSDWHAELEWLADAIVDLQT